MTLLVITTVVCSGLVLASLGMMMYSIGYWKGSTADSEIGF